MEAQHDWTTRVVLVVLLLHMFVFRCASFLCWALSFVLTVPMMVLGHLRRHKLACCAYVAFDVVVLPSFCCSHFAQGSVCPLRSLLRCLIRAFVFGFFFFTSIDQGGCPRGVSARLCALLDKVSTVSVV